MLLWLFACVCLASSFSVFLFLSSESSQCLQQTFHTVCRWQTGTWSEWTLQAMLVTWIWWMAFRSWLLLQELLTDLRMKQGFKTSIFVDCCSISFSSSQMCVTSPVILRSGVILWCPSWKDITRQALLYCECSPFCNLHKDMNDGSTTFFCSCRTEKPQPQSPLFSSWCFLRVLKLLCLSSEGFLSLQLQVTLNACVFHCLLLRVVSADLPNWLLICKKQSDPVEVVQKFSLRYLFFF